MEIRSEAEMQFNGSGMTGKSHMRCILGFETEDIEGVNWTGATPYEDAFVTIKPSEPCYKPIYLSERVAVYKSIVYPQHRPIPHPDYMHLFNNN